MLERIRTAIAAELGRLGILNSNDLRETILIREGLYCGRKFQCHGFSVIWFIEENEVKFFAPNGTVMVATSPERLLDSIEESERRAA